MPTQSTQAQAILADLHEYRTTFSRLPVTEEEAVRKLMSRGLDANDIQRRRTAFRLHPGVDGTAVLANYELLHGIPYLDRAAETSPMRFRAAVITALFRAADVCLHNLSTLACRTVEDLVSGDLGAAVVKVSWSNHFHQTLNELAQLAVRVDDGKLSGGTLSIANSVAYRTYREASSSLSETLRELAAECPSDLGDHDLDHPRRYINFHSFVNANYELMWAANLQAVRIPGCWPHDGEAAATFMVRVVQSELVNEAIHSVDLHEPTYLMQFRAYHQVSEIIVKVVNEQISAVVESLLREGDQASAWVADDLEVCCSLMTLVTNNVRPIVRTLSPRAYAAIRPALGTTSGSHSNNLRRGLFMTLYPALVRTVRLLINGGRDSDDSETLANATRLLASAESALFARIVRYTISMHQHVRAWRDEHMQFVKTQIGVSRPDDTPTASISGSENASATAHRLRSGQDADPIRPLYKALLGRDLPPTLPMLTSGGFDEHMAHLTADAVQSMYAEVQRRVHRNRSAIED